MTEEIMANIDEKEILELWDHRARDWDIQVGEDGDGNRILNSDPVLWSFAGNVAGLSVLDAGCGTGYLARQLCLKGASVTALDFSPQMIEIAQFRASQNNLDIDFHTVCYSWASSYFERRQRNDQPWNYFTTPFIWFHRPLSDYWKAFKAAGFSVDEFEELRITPERYHLVEKDQKLFNSKTRPYSVVFKLQKVKIIRNS